MIQELFSKFHPLQEGRKLFDKVKEIYDKLFAMEHVDPTLGFIQLMKFVKRTEGVRQSRAIFKVR